jgi:4-diphosphocytidyl-2-C-methyl-D-erythritol kinase
MGGTVLGTGRGEVLTPLASPPALDLVLATPPFGVDTGWAYTARREAAGGAPSLAAFNDALAVGTPAAIAAALRNDLEVGDIARYPDIETLRRELLDAGALGARMTGSGSTVFGIARDAADARRLAAADARPGRRVFAVRTLGSEAGHLSSDDRRRRGSAPASC